MDKPTTTRRDLIRLGTTAAAYAAGAAIVTGSVAAVSAAKGAEPVDRSAWEAAMKRHDAAKAAADQAHGRFNLVRAAWLADEPSLDEIDWRNVPGVVFESDRREIALNADLGQLRDRYITGEDQYHWSTGEQKQRSLAAIDGIRRFRATSEASRARHGIDQARIASDDAGDVLCDAQDALLALPAPDAAALQWKVNYLFTPEDDGCISPWSFSVIEQTLADVRRLSGGEA